MAYTPKTPDVTKQVASRFEVASKFEVEAVSNWGLGATGKVNGLYMEYGGAAWIPRNWPREFPIREWLSGGGAMSTVGSTDPEITSTVYLDYIGDETHQPEGANSEGVFCTIMAIQAAGKVDLYGEVSTTLSSMTAFVTYNFGQNWLTFFSIGQIDMGPLTTDRLAQTLAVSGTRLGVPEGGKYGRFVMDCTFLTEYNQLWLEDENERDPATGGVGVAPIFDAPTLIVEDARERLSVHSGTWGVIRSSNKIVAATHCYTNWCQNSDAPQVPVYNSPFCYAVNAPKDILWIGPLAYLSVEDHPDYQGYFSGPGQVEWGPIDGNGIQWKNDGMLLDGADTHPCGEHCAPYFLGWSPSLTRAYWAPDYSTPHVEYSYPYVSYVHPTSTTVFIFKQTKTEGDLRIAVGQSLAGNDQIPSSRAYKIDATWGAPSGPGSYGYIYTGSYVYDPYATSIWTFSHLKKYLLGLREYASTVGEKIISEWGGIVRNVIRTPAERDYWNNHYYQPKNFDMVQMGTTIIGEYEITGRYNHMRTVLYSDFDWYYAEFNKFLVAEYNYGSLENTGNYIFEYFANSRNPAHYGVNILPSKSFGNVIYGVKSYREKTHTLLRRQCQNHPYGDMDDSIHEYEQDQYGMQQYGPVISSDGGITWDDVSGLTAWNKTISKVQFKPIYLGNNQWICEHDARIYKSFTGIGWSPLTYNKTAEETAAWAGRLDPDIDGPKTYLLDCCARNEWLAVHQYENLPTNVNHEEGIILDRYRVRVKQNSIVSVLYVDARRDDTGFEYRVPVASIQEQTIVVLSEMLPSSVTKVYVTYTVMNREARLFHVIGDGAGDLTYIVKDMSFVGRDWEPKMNVDFTQAYMPTLGYDHAVATLSGGVLQGLYYGDPSYAAAPFVDPQTPPVTPLRILTTDLPTAVNGKPFVAKVEAEGGVGAYKHTVTGLPEGLTVGATTGEITGTPTNLPVGPNQVEIIVDDSTSPAFNDPVAVPTPAPGTKGLYGYVMNSYGQGVDNAGIVARNSANLEESYATTSDERGRYTLNLPVGLSFRVTISRGDCIGTATVNT